jgi:hypothetical protein
VGGRFTDANLLTTPVPRKGLAAFTTLNADGTGAATALPWNPVAWDSVFAIGATDSGIYLGGDFTFLNGAASGALGKVDAESGMTVP